MTFSASTQTFAEAYERGAKIRDWLTGHAAQLASQDDLVNGFAAELLGAGIPLDRMAWAMPTLHALRRGMGHLWNRDQPLQHLQFGWGNDVNYRRSPYFVAHETRDWVTFRLDETPDIRFDIVANLRAEGITHYVCIPFFFLDGRMRV